ncbi:hypothetical protein QBC38DRAFT_249643 [Podospora fimiseda]|uniref:Uncharacterized protein n=1 Tax=Podospora fimiseda TaxID=252190 RepID=A0AAN7BMA9_9PEZI|nr:hypothetical protein QBC38DRAFT_249643 [Podospora fimiseda]
MGGKVWSVEEERHFWRYCMPRSHKRTDDHVEKYNKMSPEERKKKKYEVMEWSEIAKEMAHWAAKNGGIPRRQYTTLGCFEHFYLNTNSKGRTRSPWIGSMAKPYIDQLILNKQRGKDNTKGDPVHKAEKKVRVKQEKESDDEKKPGLNRKQPRTSGSERRAKKIQIRRDREQVDEDEDEMEGSNTPQASVNVPRTMPEETNLRASPNNNSTPDSRETTVTNSSHHVAPISQNEQIPAMKPRGEATPYQDGQHYPQRYGTNPSYPTSQREATPYQDGQHHPQRYGTNPSYWNPQREATPYQDGQYYTQRYGTNPYCPTPQREFQLPMIQTHQQMHSYSPRYQYSYGNEYMPVTHPRQGYSPPGHNQSDEFTATQAAAALVSFQQQQDGSPSTSYSSANPSTNSSDERHWGAAEHAQYADSQQIDDYTKQGYHSRYGPNNWENQTDGTSYDTSGAHKA